MRRTLLIACFALWACEENLDAATPEGALHQLRDAVLAKDADGLLGHTSAQTHSSLAELHTLLKEQRQTIADRYPAEHQGAAHTAYPPGALEAADTGALFQALIKPQLAALEVSDGLRFGLTVMGAPTVSGTHATVNTQSGETVDFVLEDGKWVTTTFERTLARNLERARQHQQTITENLKVFEELKRREAAKKAKEAEAAPPSAEAPASQAAPTQSP